MEWPSSELLPLESPLDPVDSGPPDATRLLADLQSARTHLNRAIDLLPSLTIDDQNRRRIEAHVAVLKVRLMQLLDEL